MKNLAELLPDVAGVPMLEVNGITDDSRAVAAGDVFVAVAGERSDGHAYAGDAVARGAVAVLAETPLTDPGAPVIVVPDLKRRRGPLAARVLDEPSAALHCVGVTGTNGKTSVAHFLANLVERLGHPCGYIGTIGWGRPAALQPAALTTASAIDTQKRLAALLADGCEWIAMEVSSHALDQERVAGVAFDTAVFTNLSRDHLDYHGDVASYAQAKARLFERADVAVINSDDAFGAVLLERRRDAGAAAFGYGRNAQVSWADLDFHRDGVRGVWNTPWGSAPFELPLVGEFSVANMTAVMAVLCVAGMPLETVAQAAAAVPAVPGRVEFFHGATRNAVVDYAHTPDALEKVLDALKPHVTGRLIVLFGCGGDRDRGKRPQMAAVAEEHADVLWLTSDNPRSEDPVAILRDVRAGLSGRIEAHEEPDRRAAIGQALESAGVDDLVVVAGKGHEDYQEIGGRRLPFSDRDIVRALVHHESSAEG